MRVARERQRCDIPGLLISVALITTAFGSGCGPGSSSGSRDNAEVGGDAGTRDARSDGSGDASGTAAADAKAGGPATAISATYHSACALLASTGVACWGALGNPDRTLATPFTSGATSLSVGVNFACAVTSGGAVECWDNPDGLTPTAPAPVAGLSNVAAVSCGNLETCVITASGGVECWGDNTFGQLGSPLSVASSQTPLPVMGLPSGVVAVSTGVGNQGSVCAVTAGGAVMCWGSGYGPNPVQVQGLTSGVTSVSVGGTFACAITAGGGVMCWGDDTDGQLGDGTTKSSAVPVQVSGLTSGVTAISAGTNSSCAVTTGGGVVCWGADGHGSLGNTSTTKPSSMPVPVTGLSSGVVGVSVGFSSACAVKSDGGIECWGWNYTGELGDGTTTDSFVPVQVVGI